MTYLKSNLLLLFGTLSYFIQWKHRNANEKIYIKINIHTILQKIFGYRLNHLTLTYGANNNKPTPYKKIRTIKVAIIV